MTKTYSLLALSLAGAVSALGQGQLGVNNSSGARVLVPAGTGDAAFQSIIANNGGGLVNPQANATTASANNFVAQVFYGAGNTPLGAPMPFRNQYLASGAFTASNAGVWNAGANNPRTLDGVASGSVSGFVAVWDQSVFATWSDAAAALAAGVAPVGTLAGRANFTTTLTAPPATPAGVLDGGFAGFTLTYIPVPEPTTIALGALGVGALLWRRRSK
jgi:hypothetical protein